MNQKRKTHQKEHEKAFLLTKAKQFDLSNMRAEKKLNQFFGYFRQEELRSVARIVAHELDIKLTREYYRRRNMLLIWFEEHYDQVMPFIENRMFIQDRLGKRTYMHNSTQQQNQAFKSKNIKYELH